ncbi:acyl-CoA dehydrogenase family protein [Haliangium ochraceum]|uniref:Acyl-CoA dehydrogenase n=1 Tax=Haliangium ochraceum (strain DSM 14365 / JCM 11303 / SMP-2) TaxID=502025 RepID=D0LS54_HALO1|nr:acyl-CoA dehydrogenase family protein [Haliangium ochraceum]ACY13751.1 acyl-CoA dehydrogenase domain protein [Haliangium ochraceum DSM 14365]AMM72019.1 acyl-CoA dehydrogenase [Haliangium ochraceum DSM 14365]
MSADTTKKNPLIEPIRGFVREHVLGREQQLDAGGELPLDIYEAFRKAGLANWWLPESYGGHGLSLEQSVDIVAELAYGDAGLAFAFFLPILSTSVIEQFGSEEQKQRYLPALAKSGGSCATMASEEKAGSELIRTEALARGSAEEGFKLSGDKYFSTNADTAELLIVYARIAGPTPAYGAFLVPRSADGIRIVRRWEMNGLRASGTYELELRDCPAESQLAGNGLRILEVGLNSSRTLMAACAVGIARRVRDVCLGYARNKEIKNTKLFNNHVFGAKLGQMEAELDGMMAVCRTAAREMDEIASREDAAKVFFREGTLKSVIVAKMLCGQLGWKIASVGSESLGGLGYTHDSIIGKLLRDVRYVSLVEAGDDVLRDLVFSRHVLPRFMSEIE